MPTGDWYPPKLADRISFHANLDVQAQATGTTYGLSAQDKTDITNDKNNVALVVNHKEAARAYAQAVTEWADLILNGPIGTAFPVVPTAPTAPTFAGGSKAAVQARTRLMMGVVKADPEYSAGAGEAYGIIAPEPGPPVTPKVKRATTQTGNSHVVLKLFKGGHSLLAIDMRRAGGIWEQIGVSQIAVFTDTTAPLVAGQPEQREYRCQGMANNARTGDYSGTVSVVTVP